MGCFEIKNQKTDKYPAPVFPFARFFASVFVKPIEFIPVKMSLSEVMEDLFFGSIH